ncbi:hypothetical protein PG996_008688 [Apiospora saccharicola]|uniref:Uncharacterized protein n=1 Tax=Apiospora saccharicola TaxID=335842 RepID=A0ABR1UYL8_9PEZI
MEPVAKSEDDAEATSSAALGPTLTAPCQSEYLRGPLRYLWDALSPRGVGPEQDDEPREEPALTNQARPSQPYYLGKRTTLSNQRLGCLLELITNFYEQVQLHGV